MWYTYKWNVSLVHDTFIQHKMDLNCLVILNVSSSVAVLGQFFKKCSKFSLESAHFFFLIWNFPNNTINCTKKTISLSISFPQNKCLYPEIELIAQFSFEYTYSELTNARLFLLLVHRQCKHIQFQWSESYVLLESPTFSVCGTTIHTWITFR